MDDAKLTTINITEYNLIATKDPSGSYDRKTRENLYWVIEKLRLNVARLSPLESRLYEKFREAEFGALNDKEKRVKFEIARYRLSNNVKQTIKLIGISVAALISTGAFVYQFVLDKPTQGKVQMAYFQVHYYQLTSTTPGI